MSFGQGASVGHEVGEWQGEGHGWVQSRRGLRQVWSQDSQAPEGWQERRHRWKPQRRSLLGRKHRR